MKEYQLRVPSGVRAGFWYPGPHACAHEEKWKRAFKPVATYIGPDLGDPIIGTKFEQNLMEGPLRFRVGVLFRPDRGPKQRLETILILENFYEEMFDYSDWEKLSLSAGSM